MINRGFTCILAVFIVGLTLSRTYAEDTPKKFDPDKLARDFMGAVVGIQAEISIPDLKDAKTTIQNVAAALASALDNKKAKVDSIRKDIKAIDNDIQSCHLQLATAISSGNTDKQEAQLKALEAQRRQLVQDEAAAYKTYATSRGEAVVFKIIFQLIISEIDKRLDQLGNNTANGTWSATFTTEGGMTLAPQSGDFSLLIDTNGVISGSYTDGGKIPISGKLDTVSGACSGVGNDPSSPSTWNGTLKKGSGGYTGSGSLSFKPKGGGSGSGSWSTK